MKWLKVAICSIIIIIILLIILLLVLVNNKSNNPSTPEQEGPKIETEPIENANMIRVSDRNDYYTIKYILDTYFRYINYIDATAEDLELTNISNQQEIIQEYTNIAIKGLKNIIDKDYFKENKTDEKIREDLAKSKNKTFRMNKLYAQDKSLRQTVYFAYVTLDFKKEIKLIIKIDSISNCFSILPEDYINKNGYSEDNLNQIEVKDIISNDDNEYEYISVTDRMMAESYLEDYANIIMNDRKRSYEMLEEEYKQQRFLTLTEYENYINNAQKDYEMISLKEYATSVEKNNKIYTCKDQYGNTYIFKEKGIMEYDVQLDDYTLNNERFNEIYQKAEDKDKGILNIDKFFAMINMQDYVSAYRVLDENFKQNYFKTQADFETYIKSKAFRYNKVTYQEYSNKITDIYTYKIQLTDKTEEKQGQVEFNMVVKLLEGTNFVMSFAVN